MESVKYSDLGSVMSDNIVYLSDDFFEINNLEIDISGEYGINGVEVFYNVSKRKKSLSHCVFLIQSKEDSNEIPIEIVAHFSTKKDGVKEHKYEQEYNGYKYCIETRIGKYPMYYVKTIPKKGAVCTMSLTLYVKEDVADKYSEEEKNARIEQIFKSAIDNIEYCKVIED